MLPEDNILLVLPLLLVLHLLLHPHSHPQNRAPANRGKKWFAIDMNVQAIILEQGTVQLRLRTIATKDVHQNSSSLEPQNEKKDHYR